MLRSTITVYIRLPQIKLRFTSSLPLRRRINTFRGWNQLSEESHSSIKLVKLCFQEVLSSVGVQSAAYGRYHRRHGINLIGYWRPTAVNRED